MLGYETKFALVRGVGLSSLVPRLLIHSGLLFLRDRLQLVGIKTIPTQRLLIQRRNYAGRIASRNGNFDESIAVLVAPDSYFRTSI